PTKVNVKAPTPEELQSQLTNAQKELAKVRQAMEELLREVRNQKGKNKELMEKLVGHPASFDRRSAIRKAGREGNALAAVGGVERWRNIGWTCRRTNGRD
ncbi:MAG TPA: hypothetical protein VKD72_18475, partial [Gemmataceae bacterium]|nr:hypothetical protein [Gemmataceae bacterium]